jgi:hypothetical protein
MAMKTAEPTGRESQGQQAVTTPRMQVITLAPKRMKTAERTLLVAAKTLW